MKLTFDDLIIRLDGIDRGALLDEWKWAMAEPMQPVMLTAMGDVFAQGQSGAVYFVHVAAGTIERVADDGSRFKQLLNDREFVAARTHPQRIFELRSAGLSLGPGEAYVHQQPLAMGGQDVLDNLVPMDLFLHVSIHGQIHAQVKGSPPGTPLGSMTFD